MFGSADIHAGTAAVADPRIPEPNERLDPPPIIIALDGTWHRPLTTWELFALQGFDVYFPDGRPVVLVGGIDTRRREWIGNAIPPRAAKFITEAVGAGLLVSEYGDFVLSETSIWVSPIVRKEPEAEKSLLMCRSPQERLALHRSQTTKAFVRRSSHAGQ